MIFYSIFHAVPVLTPVSSGAMVTDTDHSIGNKHGSLVTTRLSIRQVETGLSQRRSYYGVHTPVPSYHHLALVQVNSASHCGR